ncbi:TetR family transcriptional regulator [Paenibacillus sp. PK3_47]|uniref:TetR/AcrR family transcriptional regulator n=1 Tax=Paenibacillus sp. PK3_47 TaxID=2072642 RepID=UPI00201DA68C|nr:TetR/AcrR family transcriptional regulator [Paenibacillus sp. PK3_47]UQZ36983.1 TetR family transcriptional regulator [Paenibacillus sp. PK3_47]
MRKRGAVGAESRQRLLEAAGEEFAQNGFHQTKISTIVAKAGVTQPAFYLYFANKEAAFAELVNEFRRGFTAVVRQSHVPPGKNQGDLKRSVVEGLEQIYHFLGSHPDLTRIGLFEAAEAAEIKAEVALLMKQNLIEEQQAGYFRQDVDTEFFAESLFGIVERLTLIKLLPGLESPLTLAQQTQDLFFYGILDAENRGGST